ncbi:Na+/H+ antiporter subunit G [Savagea sp. SN6]|uniref:Na+/H+ antiporter subunit G n=1 Tax=Savagea serpentis TaxID=2785297 RepID=A0A8J7KI34_9BACL|nr:monovalent cation/H(+) antiporter subunit G [Savagea serpentis]MBF4501823.1 Na+/H+ antiporter subunit G [Savagea serpentis]
MTVIANTLIVITISVGVLFTLVTMIGILRLPDVYTRAHAASKSTTFGVLSILLGVFFHYWLKEGLFSIQLLLAIVFLFITSPIGGHLMGRAAYISGVEKSPLTVGDELEEVVEEAKRKARPRPEID